MAKRIVTLTKEEASGRDFGRLVTAEINRGGLVISIEEWGSTVDDWLDLVGGSDSYEYSYRVPKRHLASFLESIGCDTEDPLTDLEARWSTYRRTSELIEALEQAQSTHEVRLDVY